MRVDNAPRRLSHESSNASDHSYSLRDYVVTKEVSPDPAEADTAVTQMAVVAPLAIDKPKRHRGHDLSPFGAYQSQMEAMSTKDMALGSSLNIRPLPIDSRPHLASHTPEHSINLDTLPTTTTEEFEAAADAATIASEASDQARPLRRSLHVGRQRSVPLRVSIDLPKGNEERTLSEMENGRVTGRVVRRRRRLPFQLLVALAFLAVYSAIVTTLAVAFGAYNFSKLKQNRANDAVDKLRNDLMPLLLSIRDALVKR